MLILFFYIIENIIIARYLEFKKLKLASAAHAVLFIIFSLYLFFPPFSSYSAIKEIFMGKDLYTLISEVINQTKNLSYFTFNISTFISIIMLIMFIISIALIGIIIIEKCIELIGFKNQEYNRLEKYFFTRENVHSNKIFKLNCCYRYWYLSLLKLKVKLPFKKWKNKKIKTR